MTACPGRTHQIAAICGMLAGPVLLVANLAGALAQPERFSFIHHPSSDLGADTADAAWVSNQVGSNLPGLLLVVFAFGLWQTLGRHTSARISAFLVGAVGIGVFLTGFFTLDCREIDTACENTSWEAVGHVIVAVPTLLMMIATPFVIARALKSAPRWRDLRRPTLVLGGITIAAGIGGSAIGEGLGRYLAFISWFTWITLLAIRMLRLAREDAAEPMLYHEAHSERT
jgi:hypothetical protein